MKRHQTPNAAAILPGPAGILPALAGLVLLLSALPALAVDPGTTTALRATVSAQTLEARIRETEENTSLEESVRTSLLELYRNSLGFLEKAAASGQQAETYRQARKTASGEALELLEKLEKRHAAEKEVTLKVTGSTPLPEVEQEALKRKADASAVEAKLNALEDRLEAEAGRPAAIQQQLTLIRQRQAEIALGEKLPAATDQPAAVVEARRWALETESLALDAEILELDQELLSQPMRIELLKARRDEASWSLARIRQRVQLLEAMLSSRRVAEATRAQTEAEAAQRDARGEHPLVRALADRNAELSTELAEQAARLDKVLTEDDGAELEAKRIAESLRSTRQKVELAGLSQALGQILIEQRRELPDLRSFRRKADRREEEIAEIGLRMIQYEEERRTLRDIPAYVDNLMTDLPGGENDWIRERLAELAENRRELVSQAVANTQSYLRALGELEYAYRNLLEKVEAYDGFLGERLLWVRSVPLAGPDILLEIPQQLEKVFSPGSWYAAVKTLFMRGLRSPLFLLALVVPVALLARARAIRGSIVDLGRRTGKPSTDRFTYTLKAFGLTLLLAIPWPLFLWVSGYELAYAAENDGFQKAVSRALLWIGPALFYLLSFRSVCLPGGLAERHFRWDKRSLQLLRRQLLRFMLVFLPAGFIAIVIINLESKTMGGGIGRLMILVVLLALALFCYRLFNPGKGALQTYLARKPGTLLARLRHVWLALSVITPLVLAVIAILGYLYTAGILTRSLLDTLWMILVLVILHQLVVRWLLVTRRRLAFQAALERRRARAEAAEREPGEAGDEAITDEVEEPVIDLVTLGDETRKLLNMVLSIAGVAGVYLIWSDVLPAFGILDDVTLWHVSQVVEGQDARVAITLADIGLALLVGIVTLVAARRFPAFLEIVLLQRLQLTTGGRYTAKTLSRYAIVAVGIVLAISLVGGSWGQIQWLVAALGVGIGFGLQEIVANFISGLIILFERPIRVGDLVTVGETEGVVSRIQIRATTILTWDRQELLVPNKEFITGRLLNWSLSDPVTRLVVPVGIAYGSDVALAMKIIVEVAEADEDVLEEPKAFVIFESFGDNSLLLTLRCFTESVHSRFRVISNLNVEINRRFGEAGIVIAFPQRDLHIDASNPLDIRILRDTIPPAGDGRT